MLNHFKEAYEVDNYPWRSEVQKLFIFKLVTQFLDMAERRGAPNRYVSELPKEYQDIIVEMGNSILERELKALKKS